MYTLYQLMGANRQDQTSYQSDCAATFRLMLINIYGMLLHTLLYDTAIHPWQREFRHIEMRSSV